MQSMHGLTVMVGLALITTVAAAPRPVTTVQPNTNVLSAPLQLTAWEKPNCTGDSAFTQFTNSVLARNISNALVSRSFKLSRALMDQEQLDISVTRNFATWYSNKDQLSYKSSSCTNLWQTYYAANGSTACHSTPPFTCHRLWNNPGLPTQ